MQGYDIQEPLQSPSHAGPAPCYDRPGSDSESTTSPTLSVSSSDNLPDHRSSEQENELRHLTYFNGLGLVLGLQIGSGIFSSPSEVNNHVPSPGVAIITWLLAGMLVWTGACSFIELGSIVPYNGGIQEYLRYCYGDFSGFLFAWVWILIAKPCAMGMVALIMAEHLCKATVSDNDLSIWALKGTALAAVYFITLLNCIGTRSGPRAANMFLILKVSGLGSIAVVGIVIGLVRLKNRSQTDHNPKEPFGWFDDSSPGISDGSSWQNWISLGSYTTALFAALFAYGGWENISFVVGEMKDPWRDLPRVINNAMIIVITLFALANIALYIVLPREVLSVTNTVAVAFGKEVFGRSGGLVYSWIVSLSCLGALNANVYATGRLTFIAGKRAYLPTFLNISGDSTIGDDAGDDDQINNVGLITRYSNYARCHNVPTNAMLFNGAITTFYILLGSFRALLTFIGLAEYIIFFATVLGVLVLRARDPTPTNSHRTWTLNPITFCVVSGGLILRGAITQPVQGLIILIFFGCGKALHRSKIWQKLTRRIPPVPIT